MSAALATWEPSPGWFGRSSAVPTTPPAPVATNTWAGSGSIQAARAAASSVSGAQQYVSPVATTWCQIGQMPGQSSSVARRMSTAHIISRHGHHRATPRGGGMRREVPGGGMRRKVRGGRYATRFIQPRITGPSHETSKRPESWNRSPGNPTATDHSTWEPRSPLTVAVASLPLIPSGTGGQAVDPTRTANSPDTGSCFAVTVTVTANSSLLTLQAARTSTVTSSGAGAGGDGEAGGGQGGGGTGGGGGPAGPSVAAGAPVAAGAEVAGGEGVAVAVGLGARAAAVGGGSGAPASGASGAIMAPVPAASRAATATAETPATASLRRRTSSGRGKPVSERNRPARLVIASRTGAWP